MTVYLGIDFGVKNLGFATAESTLATPLGSLKYEEDSRALTYIEDLITKHSIQQIVLGIPEGVVADKVKRFGRLLESKFSLPVIYHPETLTTQDAKEALRATGSRAKRKDDHTYAACLILEDYLELHS